MRIATRQAFRRLSQRHPTADLDTVAEPVLADSSADPTRVVVAAERRGEIRDAVAALPDPYRETVALRFFGELSLAEIAETTGRPLGTVKTHLRRGLERLAPSLAPEAER
jgi:RNA polymerase sigma-70 factor (ECF subfamily)